MYNEREILRTAEAAMDTAVKRAEERQWRGITKLRNRSKGQSKHRRGGKVAFTVVKLGLHQGESLIHGVCANKSVDRRLLEGKMKIRYYIPFRTLEIIKKSI